MGLPFPSSPTCWLSHRFLPPLPVLPSALSGLKVLVLRGLCKAQGWVLVLEGESSLSTCTGEVGLLAVVVGYRVPGGLRAVIVVSLRYRVGALLLSGW